MWYSVIAIPHAKMTPNDVSRENKRVVQLWNSLLYHLRFNVYSGDAASLACDEAIHGSCDN